MTEGDDRGRRHWLPDAFGLAWVIAAAGAVMAPALSRGWFLGPYDQLAGFGLSTRISGAPVNTQLGDLMREFIPWTDLAWTQVHHGLLPIWNPYSALGAPLAFNWQSAPFSLPSLIGYLFPVGLDFTIQILLTLLIAGTGMYVLARVMRLGALGAAMAATVFELSGAFMTLLGWPIAAVMSWSGWLFACVILVVRGSNRPRNIALLAVTLAFAIYSGQPDTLIVLLVGLSVFAVLMIGLRARRFQAAIKKPALDIVVASLAGLGLAAPLVLPAVQVSGASIRGLGRHPAFPLEYVLNVAFQRFNGFNRNGTSIYFGAALRSGLNYLPTAVYVGAIAVVLAVIAVITRRKRPGVLAFAAVTIVAACLVFASPLVALLNDVPLFGEVRWVRSVQVLALGLAILSGVGLDVLARSRGERKVRRRIGIGFASLALVLLAVWLFGRGDLSSVDSSIRAKSFLWPVAEVAFGLAVWGLLMVMDRVWGDKVVLGDSRIARVVGDPSRIAAALLLVGSTAFLIPQVFPWWPSAQTAIAPNKAEVALKKAVGNSVLGFGLNCWYKPSVGIVPNVNAIFGVHEFDSYDPITPQQLFTAWELAAHTNPRPPNELGVITPLSVFCPVVNTAQTAREFGIGFVLEPSTNRGPKGSAFVEYVDGEALYRIPDSSVATLSKLGTRGSIPPANAPGTPVAVTYPNDQSWKLVTHGSSPQVLRLRLTDVPGWHASIDGKPLKLTRYDRIMFQAKVPSGTHLVELHYWPDALNAGIVIFGTTAVALLTLVTFGRRLRRKFLRSPASL
jgi:hypothetical protein